MPEYNIFDYLLLIGVPLAVFYICIKYVAVITNYFISPMKLQGVITGVAKDSAIVSPFGPFSYLVEYKFNKDVLTARLQGFATPFYYRIGDEVNILLNKNNRMEVMTTNFRGQLVKILVNILIAVLVVIGAMYCLDLLNVVYVSDIVHTIIPLGFFLISCLMFGFTLYTKRVLDRRSSLTIGSIKDLIEVSGNDNSEKVYKPVIEYQHRGKTYQSQSEIRYYNRDCLGKKVNVFVLIDMPEFAEVDSFEYKWIRLCFWFSLSIISLVATFLI